MGLFPAIYMLGQVRFFPGLVGAANSKYFLKFKIGYMPPTHLEFGGML